MYLRVHGAGDLFSISATGNSAYFKTVSDSLKRHLVEATRRSDPDLPCLATGNRAFCRVSLSLALPCNLLLSESL